MGTFKIRVIYTAAKSLRYTTFVKVAAKDLEQAVIDATNKVRTYPKCESVIHAGAAR